MGSRIHVGPQPCSRPGTLSPSFKSLPSLYKECWAFPSLAKQVSHLSWRTSPLPGGKSLTLSNPWPGVSCGCMCVCVSQWQPQGKLSKDWIQTLLGGQNRFCEEEASLGPPSTGVRGNLQSLGNGGTPCPTHLEAVQPQSLEGMLRRIKAGQAELRAAEDRTRPAGQFLTQSEPHLSLPPHFLLTWSVTGAIGGV